MGNWKNVEMKTYFLFYLFIVFIFGCSSLSENERITERIYALVKDELHNIESIPSSVRVHYYSDGHDELNIYFALDSVYDHHEVEAGIDLLTFRLENELKINRTICYIWSFSDYYEDTLSRCYSVERIDSLSMKYLHYPIYFELMQFYTDSIPVSTLNYWTAQMDEVFAYIYDSRGTIPLSYRFEGNIEGLLYEYSKLCSGETQDKTPEVYLAGLSVILCDSIHSSFIDRIFLKCDKEPINCTNLNT